MTEAAGIPGKGPKNRNPLQGLARLAEVAAARKAVVNGGSKKPRGLRPGVSDGGVPNHSPEEAPMKPWPSGTSNMPGIRSTSPVGRSTVEIGSTPS